MLSEQLKEVLTRNKDPFADILGQEEAKKGIKGALLTDRRIIIVGPPGIGKTTLAKNISKLLPDIDVMEECSYHCTPQAPICPSCKQKAKHKTVKLEGSKR